MPTAKPSTSTTPKAHSKGQRVGYVRVSSADQNTDRQLDGVQLDKVFTDKASGKDTNRPQLQAMLEYVREGDHVLVHSMDRLARSMGDLEGIVSGLTSRGVSVAFSKEGLTFTGQDAPMNTLMLQLLGAVGQFERALLKERQREGIAKAKEKGDVYLGRKPKHPPEVRAQIAAAAMGPFAHRAAIAREHGISRQTLYSYLREAGQDHDGAMAGSGPWNPDQDTATQVHAASAAEAAAKVTAQAIKAARKTIRKATKATK